MQAYTRSVPISFKKILLSSFVVTSSLSAVFVVVEPAIAQAVSASDTIVVSLQVDTGITISNPGNTQMSVDLGVTTNSAVATSTFTIATNDHAGYTLTVQATSTPAMKNASNVINDAALGNATWAVPSNSYQFGFGAYGPDVVTATWGTGNGCSAATSTPSTTLKYRGFNGATPVTVSANTSTTTTTGNTTTVCYAVGQNAAYVPSGVYTATVTATATAN